MPAGPLKRLSIRRSLVPAIALVISLFGGAAWQGTLAQPAANALRPTHGIAIGDLTSSSAVVWSRVDGEGFMHVEVQDPRSKVWRPAGSVMVNESSDYIGKLLVKGLPSGVRLRYRVSFSSYANRPGTDPIEGEVTLPPASGGETLRIVWGADLGGHGEFPPFPILSSMAHDQPDVFVFLGDTVYVDTPPHYFLTRDVLFSSERCPSPARTLDEFRCKYKELRVDSHLQGLLASVGVYAIWDDHEVRDNFQGPTDPLMPIGRQTFLEYWPICPPAHDPVRLYRKFHWGDLAEVFILDTRQYRDPNSRPDSPSKTMLGAAQIEQLLADLANSTADYKIIINSLPISIPILNPFQRDGWANGPGAVDVPLDPTGFEAEFRRISDVVSNLSNVYFLSADAHYAQAVSYDPDGDGVVDYREFVTGPLAALRLVPQPLDPTFGPTSLYAEGAFSNYGVIEVGPAGALVETKDERGVAHYSARFEDETPGDRAPSFLEHELDESSCATSVVHGLLRP